MTQTLANIDRNLRAFSPRAFSVIRAQGSVIWTDSGREIIDLGGASHGTALIGHNHPCVVAAIQTQAAQLTHVTANIESRARTEFLDALHDVLPGALPHSFLCNSGTEAVECAIKLAIADGRTHMVAMRGGFHGRTLGALATTARISFRTPFQGRLAPTEFVAPNDIDALVAAIGPDTAAVILEPIQGEGGVHTLTPEFLRAARQACTNHGALLISDEVQTGFRTGVPLAISAAGITPDIATLGKGLAGGLPIGVCSVSSAVADRLQPGMHGSTYGGSPLVSAAGTATLGAIGVEHAAHIETTWRESLIGMHPAIVGIRGRGAMLAIELRMRATEVLVDWERRGVTALPAGPRAIRILPPLTMTDIEIQRAARTLIECLPEVG